MERSGSQKALLVISIIEIVFAVLALIGGVSSVVLTGVVAGSTPEIVASGNATAQQAATGTAALAVLSVIVIVSGVWSLLCGIFGIRAANDNQKIMIVWVFTLIGVIAGVISIIAAAVNGSFAQSGVSLVVSLIIDGVLFWLANNIKKEAGK